MSYTASTDHIRDLERNRCLAALAFDAEIDLVADPDLVELIIQIRQLVNGLAVGCNDDVSNMLARGFYAL